VGSSFARRRRTTIISPVLSVILPTLLPEGRPPRTLAALSQQDIDFREVEVVVVGDGVDPDSLRSLRTPAAPFPLIVISQPRGGQASARNRGAREARGDRLVFLDDDMDVAPDFLRHVARHLDEGADVVLTDIRMGDWVPDTQPTREARRLEQERVDARDAGTSLVFEDMIFAATAIRRTWFERAGGFDESFTAGGEYGNEDIELGYRLLRAGADIRHAPEALAYTDSRTEFPLLLERFRQVGRNDVRLARKHPELAQPLFGRKLVYSRLHRLVGTTVLLMPALTRADVPLRWIVERFVYEGRVGPMRTRLWLGLRDVQYWRGVAEAGGKTLALAGRASVKEGRVEEGPLPARQRPGV
jgi:GT2 family glycosyltransferase